LPAKTPAGAVGKASPGAWNPWQMKIDRKDHELVITLPKATG
jgi:hypothetical protein